MKKLLAILGIGLCLQQAHATNWVQISINDEFIVYIDNDSIKTNRFTNGGTYVSAWQKTDYHQEQKLGFDKPVSSDKFLYNFDCREQKFSISYGVVYDKQGRPIHGSDMKTSTQSSATWKRIVPDSLAYTLLNHVCSLAKK